MEKALSDSAFHSLGTVVSHFNIGYLTLHKLPVFSTHFMGEENCGAESKNSQVTQLCLYTMLEIPVFPTRRVKLDCLGQFLEAGDWTNGLSQALPLNLEAEGAKKQPCFPLVTGSPVANTQPLPNPLPPQ